VQKDKPAETSSGGIIVTPDQTDTPVRFGIVVAVGFGKGIEQQLEVAVGDRVIFGKFNGVPVGDDLVILKEDEILATVTSE
jgi:co-chaperonin GroES (HSP10)